MELGRLDELIERLAADGEGVVLMPVRKGTPMRGLGTPEVYRFDGWEVGYVTPGGGGALAVEPTIPEAVEAALEPFGDD